MTPLAAIARALASLAGLTALGWGLDVALRLFGGVPRAVRWPVRALAAIVALYLAVLWPPLLAIALAGAVVRAARAPRLAGAPPDPPTKVTAVALPFGAWLALALARPLSPVYWDEFVWATKAGIEARGGWGALRAAALAGNVDVFPAGYPLLWSLAPAWLVRDDALASLTAAFLVCKLLVLAIFVATIAAAVRSMRRELVNGLAVMAAAPLVFVHAGAFYGDLSVGLLSATLLVALTRGEPRWPTPLPIAIAIALVGCKDEGLAHVAVVTGSAVAASALARRGAPDGTCARQAAATMGAAVLAFATWRIMLARAGITDLDHRLSAPNVGALPSIGAVGLRDALDPRSWGVLWPACVVGIGVVAWTARHRDLRDTPERERAVAFALAPVAHVVVLAAALACGPERVRAFALAGTLISRWLIQLAPTAALAIAGALQLRSAHRDAARANS